MDVAILLDAMLPMGRYMNRLLNPTLRNVWLIKYELHFRFHAIIECVQCTN